jgi:hypothetical protein
MWILFRATRMSWRAAKHADQVYREDEADEDAWRQSRVWRIAATLMPVLILNSMFGNTFTLYSVAPVAWLLIGWISTSHRQASEL